MTPDDRIAALIARAEKRRNARLKDREQFDQARAHGLVARHAAKLAHLDQASFDRSKAATRAREADPPATT